VGSIPIVIDPEGGKLAFKIRLISEHYLEFAYFKLRFLSSGQLTPIDLTAP
jgi:hypothetical protein